MKQQKRWTALICTLALILTLSPAAFAADGPAATNTISGIGGELYANGKGGLTRVEMVADGLLVEDYDSSYQFVSKRIIPIELTNYGGFFHGDQYNFVIFGQDNPTESDGVEVVRVVKYSQDWQRLGQASIKGVNIYKPFASGSVRCTEYNGYLLIHTCREMYESFTNDGLNHQANISFIVKQSDMSWELLGKCYVSHSFDQFILVDQSANIVRVDLGDGHPRAVTLSQYPKRLDLDIAQQGMGKVRETNLQEIPGPIGWNSTGVTMMNVAETTGNYVTAYLRGSKQNANGFTGVRDIYLAVTDKNTLTTKAANVTSAFTSQPNHNLGLPTMVSTGLEGGYLLWNTCTGKDRKKNLLDENLYYAAYSADGTVGPIKTATAPLARCQPILYQGRLVWYASYHSAPVFYGLDQNGVQKLTAGTGASTAPIKDSRPAAKPVTPEYSSKPQLTTDIPELRCAGCGYLMRAAGDKKNFDINLRGKTGGHFYLCLTCNAYAFCDACASKPGTEAVYLQHEGSCKGPA